MTSKAYQTFEATLQRGQGMLTSSIDLYKLLHQLDKDPAVKKYNEKNFFPDAGRAGVVMVVAAFDRYFTTRFSECVVPIMKHEEPSKDLIKLLGNAGLDLKGALGLLHMQRPHRRIRSLISNHFSEYTTQKFHVIDELFKAIGITNISENAQKKARRKKLLVSVQHLIRRRHTIVHAGDVDSRGKLRPFDPYEAKRRVKDVALLVKNVDEIIEKRMQR